MKDLKIRRATEQEFQGAVDWAAAEGWNPGQNDLAAFYGTDPEGFMMGFMDGVPVSSLSVVRYGDSYGFLGFYIVRADLRGSGVGIATWNAGMAHLNGRTVGLDGVVDQQDNYRKSGFTYAGRNVRHTGIPKRDERPADALIRPTRPDDLPALLAYDRKCFPVPRENFLRTWIDPQGNSGRIAKIALQNGQVTGYGVIRNCLSGYKVGPLFAASKITAGSLMRALCATIEPTAEVSVDTPETNPDARRLAQQLGLSPVFETARMYKGDTPSIADHQIYGLTSFELG